VDSVGFPMKNVVGNRLPRNVCVPQKRTCSCFGGGVCSDHGTVTGRRIPRGINQCRPLLTNGHRPSRPSGAHQGRGQGKHWQRDPCATVAVATAVYCCRCCRCYRCYRCCCCCCFTLLLLPPPLTPSSAACVLCCLLQNLSFEDRSDSWVRQEAGNTPPAALVSLARRKKKHSEQLAQVALPRPSCWWCHYSTIVSRFCLGHHTRTFSVAHASNGRPPFVPPFSVFVSCSRTRVGAASALSQHLSPLLHHLLTLPQGPHPADQGMVVQREEEEEGNGLSP
jgi:hypothetical protein